MDDDEHQVETPAEADTAENEPTDENEAQRAMEDKRKRNLERQQQEIEEYTEMRRAEREKEEEEIRRLRERREQRKKERVEEERRLAELRAQEEARRKAEEDEKRRKKNEEESKRKEDREKKKKEAEERLKPKKPNYVITKKSGEGSAQAEVPKTKEDMQKSKEQLEEEKRAILAQRIQPLNINGFNKDKLLEKAKELNDHLRKLEGDKYDLEQQYKKQQYDMIELGERARQMSKGKGKKAGDIVRVEQSFDKLAEKYGGAPAKIMLCSKYERVTDHRSYGERKTLFLDIYEKNVAANESMMPKKKRKQESAEGVVDEAPAEATAEA